MPACLGIDSSLNAVGLCLFDTSRGVIFSRTNVPPKDMKVQFLKQVYQRDQLKALFCAETHFPYSTSWYAAIEAPYVIPFGSRGRSTGGQQTPNMFSLYSLLLDELRRIKVATACFHLAQLRSIVHGRGATTKGDTIALAHKETGLNLNEHEADAYFVAKFGARFWQMFDGDTTPLAYDALSQKTKDVFLGTEERKTGRQGMLWRPGDAWYDFRKPNPVEIPQRWQEQLSLMLSNT